MIITAVSTLGIRSGVSQRLADNQETLAKLTEQLTTGQLSRRLGDYTSFEIRSSLDFTSEISRLEGYISVISTVRPRLAVAENTLDELERIIDESIRLINNAPTGPTADNLRVSSQVEQSIRETQILLNERLEERFLFSGTRYNTAPAGNILSLPSPPTEAPPYTVAEPNLPTYDTDIGLGTSTAAWTKESVTIDDGFNLEYGVVSVDTGFQQLVMGLRWMQAAVNDGPNFTNYSAYLSTANELLTSARDNLRTIRADVVADINTMDRFKINHEEAISNLRNEIDDIRNVDTNEVATKLTLFQNQIQASYSATAILTRLTLLDFI